MPISRLLKYVNAFFPSVPIGHVIAIGTLSFLLIVIFLAYNGEGRVYNSTALCITVFLGLYLLDALAIIRIGSSFVAHSGIDVRSEAQRLISGEEEALVLMLFNTVALVPFGFVLSEFIGSKYPNKWHCLGCVALVAFGLSLCIESIQLFFHVGIFELTDLVLNTVGAIIGAVLSMVIHGIIEFFAKTKAYGR